MRRKSKGQHEPNPIERIKAQREERLRLAEECYAGRLRWAVYDAWMLEHYSDYTPPHREPE